MPVDVDGIFVLVALRWTHAAMDPWWLWIAPRCTVWAQHRRGAHMKENAVSNARICRKNSLRMDAPSHARRMFRMWWQCVHMKLVRSSPETVAHMRWNNGCVWRDLFLLLSGCVCAKWGVIEDVSCSCVWKSLYFNQIEINMMPISPHPGRLLCIRNEIWQFGVVLCRERPSPSHSL